MIRFALLGLLLAAPVPVDAQGKASTPEVLIEEAARLVTEGDQIGGSDRRLAYERALSKLDEVVVQFPESDAAVRILLDEPVGGIDLVAVRAALDEETPDASASNHRIQEEATGPSDTAVFEAIAKCFSPPDGTAASVTFRVDLDEAGAIRGRPVLVAPERVGAPERRLYRLGLEALEACAPFGSLAVSQSVEVTFSGVGVSSGRGDTGTAPPSQGREAVASGVEKVDPSPATASTSSALIPAEGVAALTPQTSDPANAARAVRQMAPEAVASMHEVRSTDCDAAALEAAAAMDPAAGFEAISHCRADANAEKRFRIIARAADVGVPSAIAC